MKSKDLIQQGQTAAAQAIKNAADTGTTQELADAIVDEIPAGEEDLAEEAVEACPVAAITIE